MAATRTARPDLVSQRRPAAWLVWLCLPLPLIAGFYESAQDDGRAWFPWSANMVDLAAIVGAGQRLLDGQPLYVDGGVPFSMPPAAALLAIPLSILGVPAAQVLWVVLCAVVLTVTTGSLLRQHAGRNDRYGRWSNPWPPLLAALLITLAQPVRDNVALGQITLLVVFLLLADLNYPSPSPLLPRGLLIGTAAAIAGYPVMVIGIFLAFPRYRRSAVTALLTAAGLTLISWLAAPASSARYWSVTLSGGHLAEPNALQRSTNGSLPAVVARGLVTTDSGTALALTASLSVLIIGAALLAGWLLIRDGHRTVGALTAALGAMITMPLAFPHALIVALPLAAHVLLQAARHKTPRFGQLSQLIAATLALWVAVCPARRIAGELVAAGSLILIITWLMAVLASSWRQAQRAI